MSVPAESAVSRGTTSWRNLRRIGVPRDLSLDAFRRIQAIALAVSWLIVVTGATVRLTGSGLGCPDWPSCEGARPVPESNLHSLVEFGNRMVTFPTLVATVVALIAARRLAVSRPGLRWGTTAIVVCVLLQIPLGGITVRTHLHPLAVGSHFLLSMLILFVSTLTWHAAGSPQAVRFVRGSGTFLRRAAPAAALVLSCAGLLVLGMLVTAAGPHSGAEATSPVVRIGDAGTLVMLHARLAIAYAVLVLGLTWWFRRTRAGARDIGLLTVLVGVQIALGEYQYRNGLPWQVVLAHVATAGLVWMLTVRVAASVSLEPRVDGVASEA